MYPISQSLRELFLNEHRQVAEIVVSPVEGEQITITDADIQGELAIDRYCVSNNRIEIGSAIAAELTMKLNNNDGRFNNVKFEGAEMFVQIGVSDWNSLDADTYYIPMGYFTVDKAPKKTTTMTIEALDRMVLFDKPWDSALEFPATVEQIITDACDNCNVSTETVLSGLPNASYSVAERPTGNNITYRTIIQWCAELTGTCAYIDWEGELRFEWYHLPEDITAIPEPVLNTSNRYSSDIDESPITVTGISVTADNNVYLSGTDEYAINIENNGLVQADYESIVSALAPQLVGFTYTPFKAVTKSAPYIYPLDFITYVDKYGNETETIVTDARFSLNLNTKMAGKGETAANNSYASANPLTAQEQKIIETIKREINTALNDRIQTVTAFNDLISNAMGVYATQIPQADGSVQYYLHDNPSIEESQTIYTINEGGFAYTNNGWNDGNPVWEYGFSKDGNAIFKSVSAYGVEVADPNQDYSAQMVPTGFDIFYSGQKILTVNGVQTQVTDLLVKKRLQSGKIQMVPNEAGADFIYVD